MKPYKFQPYLKTTIWGGYQIAPFKGIFNAQPNVGESWEISGVPGHESVAINRGLIDDVDEGLTLVELIEWVKRSTKSTATSFHSWLSSSTHARTSVFRYILTTSSLCSVMVVKAKQRCGISSRAM